jgi:hypothetical protein
MSNLKTVERLRLLSADTALELEAQYNELIDELEEERGKKQVISNIPIKITARELVISDKGCSLAVFYETYEVAKPSKRPTLTTEGGASAIPQDTKKKRK